MIGHLSLSIIHKMYRRPSIATNNSSYQLQQQRKREKLSVISPCFSGMYVCLWDVVCVCVCVCVCREEDKAHIIGDSDPDLASPGS